MTLALGLSRSGHTVTLLEKNVNPPNFKEDQRVYAVSAANVELLKTLDIWDTIAPYATPIDTVAVKEYGSTHQLAFDDQVRNDEPYGYMVPSASLRQTLHNEVTHSQSVDFQTGTEVTDLQQHQKAVTLVTSTSELVADLVFATDGKFSIIKKLLNFPEETFTYDHAAIVCNVTHEKPHKNVALELFTNIGPLAFLPIEGNASACVFSMNHDLADAYLRQKPHVFLDKLYEIFPAYGKFKLTTDLMSYPLCATLSTKSVSNRVMLCGDAAMSIHPVAGQGMNVGLKDVSAILKVDWDKVDNIGSMLQQIHDERMPDRRAMLHFTDGIIRLFEINSPALSLARRVGLFAVEHIQPLKRFFADKASGSSEVIY